MPDVRDQLGKLGGSLMILGAGSALAYLIASRATGQPSPHLTWPVWPYYLCGAMFAVGAYLYLGTREMFPWQKYRALKRRVEEAESALENTRAELIDQRAKQLAVVSRQENSEKKLAEANAPSRSGLEVAINKEVETPRPGVGLILEIEYQVTNHDPMEHQLFRRLEGSSGDGPLYFGPPDGQANPEHQQFTQDAYRLGERRNREVPVPTRVRPGETVRGVYTAEFGWNPRRTLPDYTLVITDGRREFRVRPHGAAESASATPEPPPFELRHYMRKDPLAGGIVTSHFVGVANPPGQPERRARMSAESMNPYPRRRTSYGVDPAFPHAVPPESGGTSAAGLVIGPGQEQSWFIGNTLIGGDGRINVYQFFSDTGAAWELGPDERWRISYRITCDGVPDKPFSVVIATERGEVIVRLEG
jgi:hypothetical protein